MKNQKKTYLFKNINKKCYVRYLYIHYLNNHTHYLKHTYTRALYDYKYI